MALITQADLEARLGRSLTAEEASAFTNINNANQAYVENVIIGSAVESVDPSTRYFDGGVQHLPIDPCTSITSVQLVDDDLTAVYDYDTSDYTKEPINRTLKTMLRHRPWKFVTGIRNIAVTARFSIYEDAGTLAIVKDALLSALESEINNTDNILKESIEGYSVEFAQSQTNESLNKLKGLFPRII